MRIPINLASEPFRRDRPVLMASAACGVVLVALLGVLVFLILSERSRQTDTRASVAKLNAEVLTLSSQQAQLEATLRLPMNAAQAVETLAGNGILAGVPYSRLDPAAGLDDVLLLAVTETTPDGDIDLLARVLPKILAAQKVMA